MYIYKLSHLFPSPHITSFPISHHSISLNMNSDQCARGPNGGLLDASQIQWFNDPDDIYPMSNSAPSSKFLLCNL